MNILSIASLTLQFQVVNHGKVSITKGEPEHALFHALFHALIRQCDPVLAARLHGEPGYQPFTISSMTYLGHQNTPFEAHPGQRCYLHITCFDGGYLWTTLLTRLRTGDPLFVSLGIVDLCLEDILSTPQTDPTGLACSTDWFTLASLSHSRRITIHFSSPTAFSIGDRRFELFPEPVLVWESLLRVWNIYAPPSLHMDRHQIRTTILTSVKVLACDLFTQTLRYSTYAQKGFRGYCCYGLETPLEPVPSLTALAAFARYAGIGYKTTMGMGQARSEFSSNERKES